MKICGITAEYNPFHNGHSYQISEARRISGCDLIIAVMSGNFVQRGEPAVVNKWKRAEAAVRGGADVVIELPYVYATQSASAFAKGSVRLMELAGCDLICFGSECGNLENLKDIADTPVNPDHLHVSLDAGMSFPKAYSLLTSEMKPNDILAVSYLKAIRGTGIKPLLIQRTTDYMDETIARTASAAAIRRALHEGKDLMDSTPMEEVLRSSFCAWPELYYPYLRTFLQISSRETLQKYFLFSEGIETHLASHAEEENRYEDFIRSCTNYRYTASRIRRTCLHAMNQVTWDEVKRLPELDTLRILAFNENGRKWLHEMRKSDVRIASKFSDIPFPWRMLEYRTALMYASVMPEEIRKEEIRREIQGPVYVR